MIKALIFDFDGTLVDLFDQHLEAFQEVIERKYGIEFTREDLDAGYGMVGKDILGMFFKKHKLKVGDEELEDVARERRRLALEKIGVDVKLLPGAEELLENAKKRGLKIAVATSCSRDVCDRVFEMPVFRGKLDAVTTGSEVSKGKPDPEIFLKTARKLDLKPKECVVFEDSSYGVQAGKKAGMKVIAVATGHEPREKLARENPDKIVGSLLEFKIEDISGM
ncbi:MAG: HAD family phosphatase [Candidatus Altiarchaeales archaeon]|nr:HAD family phosphatase [Candidatus Altiarchaeales archaeon]